MTTLPFPYPLDKWCEDTLTPAEGTWTRYAGLLELSNEAFTVGQHSIKVYGGYNYYLGMHFTLNSPLSFLTYPNGKLHFKVAGTSNMSGTGVMALIDEAGHACGLDFSFNTAGVFEQKELLYSDFNADSTFDWSKVKVVNFSFDQRSGSSNYAVYIDEFYITFDVPDSILLIQSQPTGKSGIASTTYLPDLFQPQNFVTPSQINFLSSSNGVPQGLPVTISMDATTFDHWADDVNNKNPVRTFTMPTTNLTLQAVYTVSPNPLLTIDSFDQNMKNVSATTAVRLVFNGIPQVINVPFGGRVGKGSWSLTVIETATRTFVSWKKPDGSTDTNKTISWNIQSDTRLEVHWQTTGTDGGINPLFIVGVVAVGAVLVVIFTRK